MSLYVTIPINENGLIADTQMNTVIAEAIAVAPFNFLDVYLYSHGWSTDATVALNEYNLFSVELSKRIRELAGLNPQPFLEPPQSSFGVGLHWPSEITEDPSSPLNALQLFTFYTMEKRADSVGEHALYCIVRLMLGARPLPPPIRFNILGHSFGCKVVGSALTGIANDVASGALRLPPGTKFNVVLLQAATDFEDLAQGNNYGALSTLPVRVLITKSSEDEALNKWYVLAGRLANLFKTPRNALGASGPGPNTLQTYANSFSNVSVAPGFDHTALQGTSASRIVVADLSPVHQARSQYDGGIGGHHSDINFLEVYELVSGFLFGV